PGLGILTTLLLQEPISKLICIEYDRKCVEYLKSNFNKEDKLVIFNDDALKFNEENLKNNGNKFIVIANLPYNISTALLLKWLKKISLFKRFVLMFQKEVAERICASKNTKSYGVLSVLTQFLCVTKLEFEVDKSSFFPQPKINSAVVSITPKENLKKKLAIYNKLEFLCKTVFSKRRKTLKNSISSILANPEQGLLSINIDPNKRPEDLSIDEFELIVKNLKFLTYEPE
ncbi:MAG: ribosomal RNA small subunit methyltransferase A, partial [Rickettsiales bacterium]|nr:ribosomal RNA small subunit methyltransferase A [Rickettsiales bacterium]